MLNSFGLDNEMIDIIDYRRNRYYWCLCVLFLLILLRLDVKVKFVNMVVCFSLKFL